MTPGSAASDTADHPRLTEPVLTEHMRTVHGWSVLDLYRLTYFQRLVAHLRGHRKTAMRGAS